MSLAAPAALSEPRPADGLSTTDASGCTARRPGLQPRRKIVRCALHLLRRRRAVGRPLCVPWALAQARARCGWVPAADVAESLAPPAGPHACALPGAHLMAFACGAAGRLSCMDMTENQKWPTHQVHVPRACRPSIRASNESARLVDSIASASSVRQFRPECFFFSRMSTPESARFGAGRGSGRSCLRRRWWRWPRCR